MLVDLFTQQIIGVKKTIYLGQFVQIHEKRSRPSTIATDLLSLSLVLKLRNTSQSTNTLV